jgi:ABC-2 type transport system ATP-binding protein
MDSNRNPTLVEIKHLRKRYGDLDAVSDISLSIANGEIFALLGSNGAGKTTLIRMLMGILIPTSGEARIRGLDCFSERIQVMREVGYVPDEPHFYEYLRGSEIILFTGEMHGLSHQEIKDRAEPLIHRLELASVLEQFATNYSRGMRKKLALVCATLHDPDLLILDEPTSGLDPAAIRTLHELVRQKASEGKAIFFSTHLLEHAEKLASKVGILNKGRLIASGSIAELRRQFAVNTPLEDMFFALAADHEIIEKQ